MKSAHQNAPEKCCGSKTFRQNLQKGATLMCIPSSVLTPGVQCIMHKKRCSNLTTLHFYISSTSLSHACQRAALAHCFIGNDFLGGRPNDFSGKPNVQRSKFYFLHNISLRHNIKTSSFSKSQIMFSVIGRAGAMTPMPLPSPPPRPSRCRDRQIYVYARIQSWEKVSGTTRYFRAAST